MYDLISFVLGLKYSSTLTQFSIVSCHGAIAELNPEGQKS